jgi:hypothetical protein
MSALQTATSCAEGTSGSFKKASLLLLALQRVRINLSIRQKARRVGAIGAATRVASKGERRR